MNLLFLAISIPATLLMLAAALAFLRAKDVFTMTQVTMVANCYVVPLVLITIALEHFSAVSLAKIIGLIVLNIILSNLLCYLVSRRAMTNKIVPDAQTK